MTCERRLCVAILARISDTCQESVPLCGNEGADFVFFILIHNDNHCVPLNVTACSQLREVSAP